MANVFNIFGKISEEIQDFDSKGVWIAGKPDSEYQANFSKGKRGGYWFSQREMLEAADLATASKFKKGPFDAEGQRKAYMNIVNFYRDVTKMKIAIFVNNYIFEPWSLDFTWIAWAFDRRFKVWAQTKSYDDDLDGFAHSLATYGTVVAKKLDKCTERVPLRTLRNTQTARSLYEAANTGGYVIIENEFHYNEMEELPDWNIDGLDVTKRYCVYERYGLVPEGLIKRYEKMNGLKISQYRMKEGERMVLAVAYVITENLGRNDIGGRVLFMERHDEDSFPLEECHTERVDGRWLGRGEVEKQLENQIARNLAAHIRRRGMLWAVKKIFQSTDDNVQQNLIMEVADGAVLRVKPDGQISQVNTANQHTGEISQDEASWEKNSQQISFAFESATGEKMPSGTPFSLGVILQGAVAEHFDLIKRTYSNFLIRTFFDQVVMIFKQENRDEHEIMVGMGESDIESLKEEFIDFHTNKRIYDLMRMKRRPIAEEVRAEVQQELYRQPYMGLKIPSKCYDDLDHYMKLNLVDPIGPDITTLTTVYQDLIRRGDQAGADRVMSQILAKGGKAFAAIRGPRQASAAPAQADVAVAPEAAAVQANPAAAAMA